MNKALEILAESNGTLSNMRFNVTVIVLSACFCAIYAVVTSKVDGFVIALVTTMLTIAITGKNMQKGKENTVPVTNEVTQ